VGNDAYALNNGSYGLTTLLSRHARISGDRLSLNFRGKSGKAHLIQVRDRKLATVVKRCRSIAGARLFQYRDAHGRQHHVTAQDVNRYLHEATGRPFTAKEFRTWQGTLQAALYLASCERGASRASAKRAIKAAIELTCAQLGNTATICRKSYIHPAVLDAFLDGSLGRELPIELARARRNAPVGLRPQEWAVLVWLERRTQRVLAKCA
jgi:DNA topoisomerase-1